MTNEYRAKQTAELTARRDAWLALHPNDTMYPITVSCWMGDYYFGAWQTIDKVIPDGGMSTFDTVYVKQGCVDHSFWTIEHEFEGLNHTWDGDVVVITGTEDDEDTRIDPMLATLKGESVQVWPMECGWVWANQDDMDHY